MASLSDEGAGSMVLPEGRRQLRPHVQSLNVEKEEQRFPMEDDVFGPTIGTWRCNLTALSQRRNLLFVAYGCDIYVWIPDGPLQLLGSQPEMIINPVMKEPNAEGYIDPSTPHTINSILVDDLGRDEVLLLATDSGNVCGYHVEAVFSAVNRCAKSGYKRPFNGAEVHPFFVENVGRSAWGLATHKFARLIAVSANTGQITVFAFALVDSVPENGDGPRLSSNTPNLDESGQTWVPIDSRAQLRELQRLMPIKHRSRNLRLSYKGHFDNIPCVSFANFDLDANGLWMVSTDINNKVILWRVWDDLWPVRLYYPGHPLNNPPERGWSVIPLDPRTFQRHRSGEEACGCPPEQSVVESRMILDMSRAVEGIPDSSQIFVFGFSNDTIAPRDPLPDNILSPDCCVNTGRRPRSLSSPEQKLPPPHASGPDLVDNKDDNSSVESRPSSAGSKSQSRNSRTDSRVVRVKRAFSDLFEEENEHLRVPPYLHSDYTSEIFGTDQDILKRHSVHPLHPRFFPVIHFSEHHISLAPYPVDSDYQLLCRAPLTQRSFNVDISPSCDRFNMVKYIPELGLVVAASQKGRVAIISLTWQEEIGYAFRVDWIIPFYTQERNNDRPMIPLLGIAVSPMPGFEIPPDVPSIPRDIDPDDWLTFNYRILNPDETSPSSPPSPKPPTSTYAPTKNPYPRRSSHSGSADPSTADLDPASESEPESYQTDSSSEDYHTGMIGLSGAHRKHTLPELHARASQAYHPHERWHGRHPSRHYRLLMLFCDHTVMSYEFWHDWKN